jgi:hypothetical protein
MPRRKPCCSTPAERSLIGMLTLIIILLIIWLVLAVLGFVIKGLVWLAVLGIILFLATAVIGFVRRSSARR